MNKWENVPTVIIRQNSMEQCCTIKEASIGEWLLIVMSVTKNLPHKRYWNHTKIISIKDCDSSVRSVIIKQHRKEIWRFTRKPCMKMSLTFVKLAVIVQAHQEVFLCTDRSVRPKLDRTDFLFLRVSQYTAKKITFYLTHPVSVLSQVKKEYLLHFKSELCQPTWSL